LSADIAKKIDALDKDRHYKEVNEGLDTIEIEKRAEELN
jgi:hypothetical protein